MRSELRFAVCSNLYPSSLFPGSVVPQLGFGWVSVLTLHFMLIPLTMGHNQEYDGSVKRSIDRATIDYCRDFLICSRQIISFMNKYFLFREQVFYCVLFLFLISLLFVFVRCDHK